MIKQHNLKKKKNCTSAPEELLSKIEVIPEVERIVFAGASEVGI